MVNIFDFILPGQYLFYKLSILLRFYSNKNDGSEPNGMGAFNPIKVLF